MDSREFEALISDDVIPLPDALFLCERQSFVVPEYLPQSIHRELQDLIEKSSTPEFAGQPCRELSILNAIESCFSSLNAPQQLLTVASLWTYNREVSYRSEFVSSQVYSMALQNGKTENEAEAEAIFAPHKAFELAFAHRSVKLMEQLLEQPLDHAVEHVLRGLVNNYHPSIDYFDSYKLLFGMSGPIPNPEEIDDETKQYIVEQLVRTLGEWITTSEVDQIAHDIMRPYNPDDGEYGCKSQTKDITTDILMPTLPGGQGPHMSLGQFVDQRSMTGDTEWLTFLAEQDDDTLARIAKTYQRLQTSDDTTEEEIVAIIGPRQPHSLLALFNTPEFGKEFAYYIFDIAEKMDNKTVFELSDLTSSIANNQAWGFFLQAAQAYAHTNKELRENYDTLSVSPEGEEYAKYLIGTMTAIQKRTIEILGAMHEVVAHKSCSTQVYRKNGHEDVVLTNPQVFISALRLLSGLLGTVEDAMSSGLEHVLLNSSSDTFSFSYTNYENNERCRITIRPHDNPNAEARILWTVSPAIEHLDNETITTAMELAGLEAKDNTKLLADNSKGRKMREISMRLDLEKWSSKLSFDIGGTTHPEESPLNNLLATAISAGAHGLSHYHKDEVIRDNHVRETFDDNQADPEKFASFLTTTVAVLQYSQGRPRSKEASRLAQERQLDFIDKFRASTTIPVDDKLNIL